MILKLSPRAIREARRLGIATVLASAPDMRRLHPIVVATVLLFACKSDGERLVDLRTDLRTRMDELYAAYEGSRLEAEAEPRGADRADAGRSTAARLLGELNRSYFEAFCLARGRGERPFSLSAGLDAFMKDAGNERACRQAAKLADRIAELESKSGR